MLRWLRRLPAVLILIGFVPVATTACFGKFQLTRNIYKFNTEVSPDKWTQWGVFLVLSISYGLAFAVDTLFANTREFWSGQNPVSADAGTVTGQREQDAVGAARHARLARGAGWRLQRVDPRLRLRHQHVHRRRHQDRLHHGAHRQVQVGWPGGPLVYLEGC